MVVMDVIPPEWGIFFIGLICPVLVVGGVLALYCWISRWGNE